MAVRPWPFGQAKFPDGNAPPLLVRALSDRGNYAALGGPREQIGNREAERFGDALKVIEVDGRRPIQPCGHPGLRDVEHRGKLSPTHPTSRQRDPDLFGNCLAQRHCVSHAAILTRSAVHCQAHSDAIRFPDRFTSVRLILRVGLALSG